VDSDTPTIAELRHLHPRITIVWWASLVGWFAVLSTIVVVVALVADRGGFLLAIPAIAALFGVGGAVGIPRRYAHWQYRFGPDALELRSGVWWRTQAVVPYHRIQHVDIDQGPIQRQLGMVSLTLKTASASSIGGLPGIDATQADEVRDWLVARAERSDGA
jgi:membrane protein YdbS with pleckstrin-like domain